MHNLLSASWVFRMVVVTITPPLSPSTVLSPPWCASLPPAPVGVSPPHQLHSSPHTLTASERCRPCPVGSGSSQHAQLTRYSEGVSLSEHQFTCAWLMLAPTCLLYTVSECCVVVFAELGDGFDWASYLMEGIEYPSYSDTESEVHVLVRVHNLWPWTLE